MVANLVICLGMDSGSFIEYLMRKGKLFFVSRLLGVVYAAGSKKSKKTH